jgi:hypothetical protein
LKLAPCPARSPLPRGFAFYPADPISSVHKIYTNCRREFHELAPINATADSGFLNFVAIRVIRVQQKGATKGRFDKIVAAAARK